MSQSTSLEAYYSQVVPHLGYSQSKVYRVLEDATRKGFDMTNMELARLLKWSINRVTPRVKELRTQGLVVKGQVRKCGVTGNKAIGWKVFRRV